MAPIEARISRRCCLSRIQSLATMGSSPTWDTGVLQSNEDHGGFNRAQHFLAVVDSETGYYHMQCPGCKTNLRPAHVPGQRGAHAAERHMCRH